MQKLLEARAKGLDLPYNMRIGEGSKNLEFYDSIITKSNFRTKTGPFL